MKKILKELNENNSSNYKLAVLKKYKDNELLKRVLKMALDKVTYSYGITMKNITYSTEAQYDSNDAIMYSEIGISSDYLTSPLDYLETYFCSRKITGNKAIEVLTDILEKIPEDDAYILERIIERDLKINCGKAQINKVFKGLIVKPPYQRCEIGTKANVTKNIDFKKKVFSQIKMDGTYRSLLSDAGKITVTGRSGIEDSFPAIERQVKSLKIDGYVLLGEMTLRGELDRKKGNGLINSLNPTYEDIIFTVWDMISVQEYKLKNGTSNYEDRLKILEETVIGLDNVKVIEYKVIKTMEEAYIHFQEVTRAGGEGTVIKSHDMKWKDGNSKQQLKIKLIIELDMRITGFNDGNKGSKNEAYFSGINYSNDEGTIQGTIGVTTLTETLRDWFDSHREEVIGQVITIHCNDITKANGNDYFALSHPRYKELRGTEKVTDTFERSQEQKQMAMELK